MDKARKYYKVYIIHIHINAKYICVYIYISPCVYVLISFSHVWLFCNSMDCSLPVSSDHGFSQARILEWVAISFSKGSSQPRDWIHTSWFAGKFSTTEPPEKPIHVYSDGIDRYYLYVCCITLLCMFISLLHYLSEYILILKCRCSYWYLSFEFHIKVFCLAFPHFLSCKYLLWQWETCLHYFQYVYWFA